MLSLWLFWLWIKSVISLTLQDIDGLLTTSGEIGWLKVAQCDMDIATRWVYESPFVDRYSLVDLLPYAISFKLVPADDGQFQVDDFELETVVCSNPIWNLNHAKELSFTTDINTGLVIGYEDYDNWIGTQTAKGRLDNPQFDSHLGTCPVIGDAPRDFLLHVYDCCGCDQGLYIDFSLLKSPSCKWLFEANPVFYPAMVMWLGFDVDLRKFCQEDGNGNYVLTAPTTRPPTDDPTLTPSDTPTQYPSSNPSNDPSTNPTQYPSSNPSNDPSTNPTQYPLSSTTDYSSITSTVYSSNDTESHTTAFTDEGRNTEIDTVSQSIDGMQNYLELIVAMCVVLFTICIAIIIWLVLKLMTKEVSADAEGKQISKVIRKKVENSPSNNDQSLNVLPVVDAPGKLELSARMSSGESLYVVDHEKGRGTTKGDVTTKRGTTTTKKSTTGGFKTKRGTTSHVTCTTKRGTNVGYQRCMDCGKQDCGKLDDDDGLFYCNECWMKYGCHSDGVIMDGTTPALVNTIDAKLVIQGSETCYVTIVD